MQDLGTLRVRTFTSRGQIPVVSATVAVLQGAEEGKARLLALRITDENGQIDPLAIPTPPPGASLRPGGPQSFALVDILAEHPGYQMMTVEQAQVFPGVETVQDLMMIPLPEGAAQWEDASLVLVPPQDL